MTRDDLVARGLIQLRALLADPNQRAAWRDIAQQLLAELAKDFASAEPTWSPRKASLPQLKQYGDALFCAVRIMAMWPSATPHGLAQGQLDQGLAYPRSLRVITPEEILAVMQKYLLAEAVIVEVVPVRTEIEPAANVEPPQPAPGDEQPITEQP